ncbi:MAG: S8 family serine peptidase [Actinomycetota bacterium]|nr:S8 family serine peptidase [Actinomycetota bacterium]
MRRIVFIVAVLVAGGLTGVARAEFPYSTSGGDKRDFTTLRTGKGQVPNDLGGDNVWKFAATPEPGNFPVNADPRELNGVRGGHVADADGSVDTAWTVTTGRPDVVIAVLDSGIRWNAGEMADLRFKTHLAAGELPTPNHVGSAQVDGVSCGGFADADDANGDGIFNLLDFACDSRVRKDPPKGVNQGLLDPQDLLIAFSDGRDDDGNGFADDIVGWDFLDDDNDPFDDVQYGHGTGEAEGSSAEANNGNPWVGACPNCMVQHMRVGDSFVADDNRFAMATIKAVDDGALVIQEALGTLNNSQLAQRAIDYAYDHGAVVIASAADEAAQHHNYPSSHERTVVVNSVRNLELEGVPGVPRSYVSFNGCTNFSSKITLAIPSTSCSSDATGVGSGMAGLIYSAALNGIATGQRQPHPTCRRTNGDPCPLSANEVRQLMASGSFGSQTQPDDVNYLAGQPEPSCAAPAPGCTDPNLALQQQVNANRPVVNPPDSRSYPARAGHDQFFGYGRINTFRAADAAAEGRTPPEVGIDSPEWFAQVDPTKPTAELRAHVWARGASYSCRVYVAPGSYPNNALDSDTPPGDFAEVPSPVCDGSQRTGRIDGTVAALDLEALKARFPPDAGDFRGRESGSGAGQTSNGRPNSEPYGFTVRVVATAGTARGEDRRNLYLHRDASMLDGFPKQLPSDGESSPAFADIDGDNRNELVFGTADGFVHAMKRDGSEARGWPVRTDPLPLHSGRAFSSGEIPRGASHGAILGSAAIADLDRDGVPEVVAADFEGKAYAWSAAGRLLWKREADPAFSGKPLAPFENVRKGETNRTQHGFLASPVAADLDRDDGGRQEIVLAGMDRHVYAFNHDGSRVPGFPVLVVDVSKVASVDGTTHRVAFKSGVGADEQQGAIIDTPAVGNIAGDARPEIVIGTNEEYRHGANEPSNVGGANAATVRLLSQTGALANANTRLFAIKPEGERDGDPAKADWAVPGWPVRMTLLMPGLLPVVGEGVTGPPVLGPVDCPSGGPGLKAAAAGNTGVLYVFNPDGSSCLGEDGGDVGMDTDGGALTDRPAIPAVGNPAFGDFAGGVSLLNPVAGLIRALDLLASEYQNGGQDGIGVWDPASGRFRPGFPARMNDLQFLTGPAVADIDGSEGEELLEGSAHLDLQAFDGNGMPASGFPKLTSDWMVATPLIGSFGTLDSDEGARKVVVANTRSGSVLAYATEAPACTPGSWPRYHHDLANSGDYTRDAALPGRAVDVKLYEAGISLRAPGDDLMCGKVAGYELVQSDRPLTGATFDEGDPIPVVKRRQDLAEPGALEGIGLGGSLARYLAVRPVDEAGNVGPVTTISTKDVLPGTPPELEGIAGDVSACADRTPPRSSISTKSTRVGRKRLYVRGRSADRGCRELSAAQARNAIAVGVSLSKREGRRCRFVQSDGRLSSRRKCGRPIKLRAKGRYNLKTRKLEWTLKKTVKIPRGRYRLRATATDQSGNLERRISRKNARSFSVR